MDTQDGKTIDAEDIKREHSESEKLPVALTEATIAEKVAEDSTSKQMEQINAAPADINDKEMEIPTQEGSSQQSATPSKGNPESTEIGMTTENAVTVQSIVKEEPIDTEMESAEVLFQVKFSS